MSEYLIDYYCVVLPCMEEACLFFSWKDKLADTAAKTKEEQEEEKCLWGKVRKAHVSKLYAFLLCVLRRSIIRFSISHKTADCLSHLFFENIFINMVTHALYE